MIFEKRKILAAVVLLVTFLLCSMLHAQQATPAQKPLANSDIVKMVKGGVPESVILSSIQSTPCQFTVTPDALVALHRAGVSQKVMDAMMAANGNPTAANGAGTQAAPSGAAPQGTQPSAGAQAGSPFMPPPGTGAQAGSPFVTSGANGSASSNNSGASGGAGSSHMPSVTFQFAGNSQDLAVEKTQLAQTKTKASSMSSLAADSTLTQVLNAGVNTASVGAMSHVSSGAGGSAIGEAGGLVSGMLARRKPSQTYVWAVPSTTSANIIQTTTPSFTVSFAGAPGINADNFEPAIVKLTPAQNAWRLVGATQGKEDAVSSSASDWQVYMGFVEDRVKVQSKKIASGRYEITAGAELLPGEYGVVLRPISKTMKFSGGDVARYQGDGMIFDSVWSFQVSQDAKAQ